MKNNKLGHQAGQGYRINVFNSIQIKDYFDYCRSHNFVYNTEVEKEKLYNALPNFYTDGRYSSGDGFYCSCYLKRLRTKEISLKACIRRTKKVRNIPIGTIVNFEKDWYFSGKRRMDNSYRFKVTKENKFDPQYEINIPSYSTQFSTCQFSKDLTIALRENGFLVSVTPNSSFLLGMINTAVSLTGGEFVNDKITGEIAVAYGFGKKIGFSSYNEDFMGYSNGCDNILWDKFGEFDKWSRCNEISKTTDISEIIKILKDA